jgi:hypothetical protein
MLTRVQNQLQKRIADAVERADHSQIEYHSEWLGYLPYGCYHWITCKGADVDVVLSEDWSVSDLTALEQAGFLQKIDESTNPDDPFEKTIISYFVLLTE